MIALNTWGGCFSNATAESLSKLVRGGSHLDAVEAGCKKCQDMGCDGTVGAFSHPDAVGEVTLDAIIMDGTTQDVGSVGCLRNISNAIGVARAIMEHTSETMLVGEKASDFAKMMGFPEESLENANTEAQQRQWVKNKCQPNMYRNLVGVTDHCPPYAPPLPRPDTHTHTRTHKRAPPAPHGPSERPKSDSAAAQPEEDLDTSYQNHDTIGAIAMDFWGNIAAGASSNGAGHKVPGRVGDAAIVGAGAYADSEVGAAVATGDGDIMMRFLPAFAAVNLMAQGVPPTQACEGALAPIISKYPLFTGALLCFHNTGTFGAAAYRWNFVFSYQDETMAAPVAVKVIPMHPSDPSI